MRNLWKIWIGLAAALTTVYFFVENSPESKLVLYNGVGLVSLMILLFGICKNRPRPVAPWLWFAAGLASFLIADVIYYVLELQSGEAARRSRTSPTSSTWHVPPDDRRSDQDGPRGRPGPRRASFIDAAVVGIAMFGTLWVLFVDTSSSRTPASERWPSPSPTR